MSELVICPFCEKGIESDSYFCDQCGEKLRVCTKGHGFRKGKICSQCGTRLVEAQAASVQPENKEEAVAIASNTTVPAEKATRIIPQKANPQFLVGKSINAKLVLKNGAIIGRRTGEYIDTFCSQGYVSGTHAKIQRNNNGSWEIIDLESTNGTFVNGKQIATQQPVIINIGDEIAFYDTKFIVE